MGFVAVVPIRFGEKILEPGDDVPVERGRNYTQMVRLGQIAPTRDRPPAPTRSRSKRSSDDDE